MTQEEIIESEHKKHYKILLLSRLGLSNKEVAEKLSTNIGHVYNELKKYKESNREEKYLAK